MLQNSIGPGANKNNGNHMSNDETAIEEIKEVLKNSGTGQVIIFLNCNIQNVTLNNFENDYKEGEYNHHYNPKE